MRRLLIIGCGDVLRRSLPELLRRWRVYALVRERDADLAALGVVQLVGDLDRRETLSRLAGLADAVIHSAPPAQFPTGVDGDPRTRRLLAMLRKSSLPRCLVYISTSGVYGDCRGEPVPETRTPRPATVRGGRRLAAETLLRRFGAASSCRVSLLRAPGIYAADRLPLERLRAGQPLLRAEEDVFTNHIHAEDLGRACIAALRRGRANRIYNVSDDTELAMGDWYDLLAAACDLPRPPRRTREEVARTVSPAALSFMTESRRLDNGRLKRELKLRLRYPTVHAVLAAIKENT